VVSRRSASVSRAPTSEPRARNIDSCRQARQVDLRRRDGSLCSTHERSSHDAPVIDVEARDGHRVSSVARHLTTALVAHHDCHRPTRLTLSSRSCVTTPATSASEPVNVRRPRSLTSCGQHTRRRRCSLGNHRQRITVGDARSHLGAPRAEPCCAVERVQRVEEEENGKPSCVPSDRNF
jgi:hypothetical protein